MRILRFQRQHRTTSRRPARLPSRRGVTGVVAMMFLVMFGSLAVAMAVVSQGNLRTAETHLRVTRALGAVDTGMELAASRLEEAAGRFIIAKGEIDPTYASELWHGTFASDPIVTILPPADGRVEASTPSGIADALVLHHAADATDNTPSDITLPTPPEGWVIAPAIGIERTDEGRIVTAAQITYLPPDADGQILVVVTGYDWDWSRQAWVTRTARQHFSITKRVNHAVLGPSRMMIGRNVQVTGSLGTRFDSNALDTIDGPPLVVRSDFKGLSASLDDKLNDLYAAVLTDDTDGDNRLMAAHALESSSLNTLNLEDYDGDDTADVAFADLTNDNLVDEFDVFLNHYDTNGDGKVVLSAALTAGTDYAGMTPEFDSDDALAMLIDGGYADRNGNGRINGRFEDGAWDYTTFNDNNGDGLLDANDLDLDDVVLGYRDGVIDFRDRYAKVRGSAYFRTDRSDWESASDDFGVAFGDYQQFVEGAIIPEPGDEPIVFDANDAELPEFTTAHFAAATSALVTGSDGQPFETQVNAQTGGAAPSVLIESTPYGSPTPADWYARPVYEGLTFRDVEIPMGTNALFINCTFVGITHVRTWEDNTHASYTFYGQQDRDPETGVLIDKYPPPPAESDTALDQSYSTPGAPGYDSLPAPLFVNLDLDDDGITPDQCTNTKLISNNLRFHDCLFVGSVVSDTPVDYTHIRNKMQFTGATRFTSVHPDYPDDTQLNPESDDMDEIEKSSMMLPNYSVDIGTNNSPAAQDVQLNGAIIAGVLDVRGNTTIDGVLLLSFEPVYGQAPLELYGTPVGNPADFNITLGYFGPEDGDYEGIDLENLTDLDGDGTDDIGWDSARDSDGALVPLTEFGGTHDDAWYDGVPDDDAGISPGTYVTRAIPFNGFGEIRLNWDPEIILPDGLEAPISIEAERSSYREGKYVIDDGS